MITTPRWRNIFSDPEFWMILLFNGLFVFLYVIKEVSVGEVIWVYFMQSVLIGAQYFSRMLAMAFRSDTKWRFGMPFFFLIHYGGFHFVYLVFLIIITVSNDVNNNWDINFRLLLYSCSALLINMIFSTISDIKSERTEEKTPATLMFIPYLRVFPMHIFILLGFNVATNKQPMNWLLNMDAFLVFIVLKTLSDIIFHILVNKTWREKRTRVIGDVL
jgi:hypothetical protein